MRSYSKALLSGLLFVSFGIAASPFPESASRAGVQLYHTGRPVPEQYMADGNVIQNYHHYHLDKPTDGYEWVHGTENEYLLVSTKTRILRRIDYRENIPPESPGK
ncbi:RcnB family protein [Dyella jejuensis]|uniref:RcnB family protein n=1 Tax=Dyella jejuensis TaxID=1432009 RepID=A0ABW8JIB6_9GAMM